MVVVVVVVEEAINTHINSTIDLSKKSSTSSNYPALVTQQYDFHCVSGFTGKCENIRHL